MSLSPIFAGFVENGKLKLKEPEAFRKFISNLAGDVEVVVKKFVPHRSKNQNKYYWGVVLKMISNHLGFFPEEVHESLKMKFLRIQETPIQIARSTNSLTTAEMADYIAQIQMWAASELSLTIPQAHQVEYES